MHKIHRKIAFLPLKNAACLPTFRKNVANFYFSNTLLSTIYLQLSLSSKKPVILENFIRLLLPFWNLLFYWLMVSKQTSFQNLSRFKTSTLLLCDFDRNLRLIGMFAVVLQLSKSLWWPLNAQARPSHPCGWRYACSNKRSLQRVQARLMTQQCSEFSPWRNTVR